MTFIRHSSFVIRHSWIIIGLLTHDRVPGLANDE